MARRIVRQEQVAVILTSSPPCAAHLVGLLLKKEIDMPWIVDFRDEWSQHPLRTFQFASSRRLDAWQERQVLRCADHVVTVTEAYRKGLAAQLSPSPASQVLARFSTIPHGFDAADFIAEAGDSSSIQHDKFRLVYVGTLWGGVGFLTALERLLAGGDIPGSEIEVVIVGQLRPIWHLDGAVLVEKIRSLESVVRQSGWVTHREAIHYMLHANVLLLVLDSERGMDTIPGKTFEYLASGKPVLALVPPSSEVTRLLAQARCVTVVDDKDVPAIVEAIKDLYGRWKDGRLTDEPVGKDWQPYEARNLAASLARTLDCVV